MNRKIFLLEDKVWSICGNSTVLCILSQWDNSSGIMKIYGINGIINTIYPVGRVLDMILFREEIYLLYASEIMILSVYNKNPPRHIKPIMNYRGYITCKYLPIFLDIYRSKVVIRNSHPKNRAFKCPDIRLLYDRRIDYGGYIYRSDYGRFYKVDSIGNNYSIINIEALCLCVYYNFLYTAMSDGTVKKWDRDDKIVNQWIINDSLKYNPDFMGVIEDYLYMSYNGVTYRWDKKDNMTIFVNTGFKKLVKMGDSFYGMVRDHNTFKVVSIPVFPWGIPFINKGIMLHLIQKFKREGIPKDVIMMILSECRTIYH